MNEPARTRVAWHLGHVGIDLPTEEEVLAQDFRFKASWWRRYVPPPWWPASVDELPEDPARPGYQRISRQDVFNLAGNTTTEGRVRLLLAAYIWGTGPGAFLVGRRVRVFTRTDLATVGQRLVAAERLLQIGGAVPAYESLLARQPNHVKYLGTAFFTKYLYFVSGHPATAQPQPLILDKFVARSLNRVADGWNLRDNGWSSAIYGKYLNFAAEQAAVAQPVATPGGIEMGLFQQRDTA